MLYWYPLFCVPDFVEGCVVVEFIGDGVVVLDKVTAADDATVMVGTVLVDVVVGVVVDVVR